MRKHTLTGSPSADRAPDGLLSRTSGDLLGLLGERDCTIKQQSMALAAQAAEIARLQALVGPVDARDATREGG